MQILHCLAVVIFDLQLQFTHFRGGWVAQFGGSLGGVVAGLDQIPRPTAVHVSVQRPVSSVQHSECLFDVVN